MEESTDSETRYWLNYSESITDAKDLILTVTNTNNEI
jgi:hypothetical protein